MVKHLKKAAVLFLVGGIIYGLIEMLWRGHTHWSMVIAGGICFLIVGGINEWFTWTMPLALQGCFGSIAITAVEFLFGLIFNVWLGFNVWDYSNMPMNVMGQICVPFMLLWVPLAMVAVVVDDWLRYWWFKEDRPYYTLF